MKTTFNGLWYFTVTGITLVSLQVLCSCTNTQYKSPSTSQKSSNQSQETQQPKFQSNMDEYKPWYYSKEYEKSLIEKGATQDQFERLYHLKKYEQSLINEGTNPSQLISCRQKIEEIQLELKEIEKKELQIRNIQYQKQNYQKNK